MAKLTKEELAKMIHDEVQAAVAAQNPKPGEQPAEEAKPGEQPGSKAKPAEGKEEKAAQPGDAVQRKYSSIYMNTGADPEEVKTLAALTKLGKGIGWARAVKCVSQSNGDPGRAESLARKMYPQDDILHRELKAMGATAPSEGGYLIPEIYSADVIELLYAQEIVTKLGATIVPMESGNLNMPKLKSGATSQYVGEKRTGTGSKQKFGNVKMSAKKQLTKVIISNDLLRSSSYRADTIIRNDAMRAMALGRDRAALMGSGSEFEPKGLLKYNLGTLDISALPGTGITGSLMAELIKANVEETNLGWAFNGAIWGVLYNVADASGHFVYRDAMDKKQLNGYAFGRSNQLPAGADAHGLSSIVFGNWSDFLVGEQLDMEAEMFREGSAKDENDELISAIDNDCSILRLISLHDFGVRHEESFVVAKNVYTK